MGSVYVAIQEPIGRKVALKVMKPELVKDEAARKRFTREAEAVSKLQHPNTITLIDYGESDGNMFIAMEFLDGRPLSDLLKDAGPLPLVRAVDIVSQVARALVEAHGQGIIHRDMKPENIFVSSVDDGRDFVKVLDFGIAKLQDTQRETKITQAGYVCGTPEYMSPEQARGEDLDGRTDLYALSVMFWELLEGNIPFNASTPLGIVLKHQTAEIPEIKAVVPASIKAFIYQGMSKDREDRFESAQAFLNALADASPSDLGSYQVAQTRATRDVEVSTPRPIRETDGVVSFSDPAVPATSKGNKSPMLILLAVFFVVILGGGAAAFALMPKESAEESGPTAAVEDTGHLPTAVAPVAKPSLRLTSEPSGASVFAGENKLGVTPFDYVGEANEVLSLTVKSEGFAALNKEVTLAETGAKEVAVVLTPEVSKKVETILHSTPKQAVVRRDGVSLGVTPVAFKEPVDSAPFEIEVSKKGFVTRTIEITPGDANQEVTVELKKAAKVARVSGKKPPKKAETPPKDVKKKPPKNKYKLVH